MGLDLDARFRGSGTRLAGREGHRATPPSCRATARACPSATAAFDLVFSHSVIEHVASAEGYLRECHRVLRPGGVLYLSTAPYLSLAGAHLPRLLVPVPLHILARPAGGLPHLPLAGPPRALDCCRSRRRPTPSSPWPRQGKEKQDDLLQRVTVRRLGRLDPRARASGVVREDRHVTGFFRRALPGPLRRRPGEHAAARRT